MVKKRVRRGLQKLKPASIVRDFVNRDELILRDWLAMQRTTLANERTLFAYIRTSLYLILGGIGLIEVEVFENLKWAGYTALALSAFLIVYGFIRYAVLWRKLHRLYREKDLAEDKVPD